MTYTITAGAVTLTPDAVDGYETARESQNIIHVLVGVESPDVTLRPALLRAGTLRMVFTSEAAGLEALNAHATGDTFALESVTRASIEMVYVVNGRIALQLEPVTREQWILAVDYQEVSP